MRSALQDPPSARQFLLAEAFRFVQAVGQLPGVLRIALIGSLLTAKADPKDVDLLITVSDGYDLAPLALAGRKLKGRAQGQNLGADIFLINPQSQYIGRTCQWRECAPGIRLACRADHCGRRPYLYDDLRVIKLSQDLVSKPPLELWPVVVSHAALPSDVQAWLTGFAEPHHANTRHDA
jgi:hypothetical protein